MKRFRPTHAEIEDLQAEKSVGLLEAQSFLTGRNVRLELEDIANTLLDTGDNTREQLIRLVEVVQFIVNNGSVGF